MLTLEPSRPEGRQFYHIRHGKVVEILKMTDEKAADRIEHGWNLHPCELGLRERWNRS
jgi:hypothetical protein